MPTIRFIGHIIPPTYQITLPFLMTGRWEGDDAAYFINYKIAVKDNAVIADCEINNYERETHVPRLLLRAIDTSQAAIDLIAFSLGSPLSVTFETLVEPNGETFPLYVRAPDLAGLVTAFSLDTPEFQKVLKIIIEEPDLSHALRDLIEATSGAHKVVPQCAKATETLIALLAPSEIDRKLGLEEMRENLRLGSNYLKLITDQPKTPRHGHHQAIPAAVTEEVSRRSWTAMNRFLEFRKRGNKPLSLDQFPLLTG